VVQCGSLAAAARRLGLSASAVTRTITSLERLLGARLLLRTTRSTRLTDIGEQFLADARDIMEALTQAQARVHRQREEPQGVLTVTAPVILGRLHVAPLLAEYLQRHKPVSARLILADKVLNLVDESFDVAVRVGTLPDSSLTAVGVGSVRIVTVASPDYIARHGAPRTPADLADHLLVGFEDMALGPLHWQFPSAPELRLRARFLSNSGDAAINVALAGRGVARPLSYQVQEHLDAGRLVRLLQPYEPPPWPVQLVYPGGRAASAKVRSFIALAQERLSRHPSFQQAP
jgi:DNA-binding transcriptional LysR family regulator